MMRWCMRLAAAVLAVGAVAWQPAQAADADGFDDCTKAGGAISSKVDSLGQWTCTEMVRRQIVGGPNYMFPARVVRSYEINDAAFKTVTPQLLDKLEAAFKFWVGQVVLGQPGRITVLLVDPEGKDMPGLAEHGVTVMAGDECIVRINLAGITKDHTEGKKGDGDVWIVQPGASEIPREIDKVIAHEAAHCVQTWRNPAQMKLAEQGANWWIEGSAEMMASLVVPRANTTMERYKLFDQQSASVPLTKMTYQSVTFWQWLWNRSPELVPAAWDAMPKDQPGPEAQSAALKGFFDARLEGQKGFDTFAHDYLDGAIKDVTDEVITAPDWGEVQEVAVETGSVTFEAEPFTIWRRQVVFSGGDYAVTALMDVLSASEMGEPWARPVPTHTKSGEDCKKTITWKLSAFDTSGTAPLKIDNMLSFKRDPGDGCAVCQVSEIRDQCLAGEWAFDKVALAAMLAKFTGKDGDPDPGIGGGDMVIRFYPHGRAMLSSDSFQIFLSLPVPGADNLTASVWVGTAGDAPLKWSTSAASGGGQLKMCRLGDGDFSAGTMTTIVDYPGNKIVVPPEYIDVPLGKDMPVLTYLCQGNQVNLRLDGVGEHTLEWTLHRIK